jgi:hypothetical protein
VNPAVTFSRRGGSGDGQGGNVTVALLLLLLRLMVVSLVELAVRIVLLLLLLNSSSISGSSNINPQISPPSYSSSSFTPLTLMIVVITQRLWWDSITQRLWWDFITQRLWWDSITQRLWWDSITQRLWWDSTDVFPRRNSIFYHLVAIVYTLQKLFGVVSLLKELAAWNDTGSDDAANWLHWYMLHVTVLMAEIKTHTQKNNNKLNT